MSQPAAQALTASATMDREHAIQTGLIEALRVAVAQGETATADEILEQLVAYSSAHFMSEELLMRLVSYDDYDDHVSDHIRMMDELDQLLGHRRAGESDLVLDKALALEGFLLKHIDSRDARFAAWQPVGRI